ncbi:MAG: hypothetical protein ACI9QN_001966 [Arcticibacterium sp.]|jgi:uncharacterized protein (DUF2132 family)
MRDNNLEEQPNNPLHGVRLDFMLDILVDHFGWGGLGKIIRINCFNINPTKKSSLKFLRKTDWARKKVEDLYLEVVGRN